MFTLILSQQEQFRNHPSDESILERDKFVGGIKQHWSVGDGHPKNTFAPFSALR
jgi:hypothetical protein